MCLSGTASQADGKQAVTPAPERGTKLEKGGEEPPNGLERAAPLCQAEGVLSRLVREDLLFPKQVGSSGPLGTSSNVTGDGCWVSPSPPFSPALSKKGE